MRRFLEHLYVHNVRSFRPSDARSFFLTSSGRTLNRRLGDLVRLGLIRGAGRGAGRTYEVVPLADLAKGKL